MERRGSGLARIMESYNDCWVKPKFMSDVSSFKVIFPNRGYIENSLSFIKKTGLENQSPVLSGKSPVLSGKSPVLSGKSPVLSGKSPEITGNFVNDYDYFIIRLYKNFVGIRKNTCDQVQALFNKFTYDYEFKREDVEELFSVKKSRASEIISLLLEKDLIEISQYSKYKFKK